MRTALWKTVFSPITSPVGEVGMTALGDRCSAWASFISARYGERTLFCIHRFLFNLSFSSLAKRACSATLLKRSRSRCRLAVRSGPASSWTLEVYIGVTFRLLGTIRACGRIGVLCSGLPCCAECGAGSCSWCSCTNHDTTFNGMYTTAVDAHLRMRNYRSCLTERS